MRSGSLCPKRKSWRSYTAKKFYQEGRYLRAASTGFGLTTTVHLGFDARSENSQLDKKSSVTERSLGDENSDDYQWRPLRQRAHVQRFAPRWLARQARMN